jgi:DMSO/TMAO reductase YedYZ molybdopterin-dependent catalytic subunit
MRPGVIESSHPWVIVRAMTTTAARHRVIPWAPAIAGALSVGVAIGASELFAGFTRAPSLVGAIGGRAINLQPPGAKDVMVSLFGTNDKLALNALIVVVAVAVGTVAGILAARRFRTGAAVIVLFGCLAAGAAVAEPLATPSLGVVNAALAGTSGLLAMRWLLAVAPRASDDRASLADAADWRRRRFLIASAGTLGGVIVAGGVGRTLVDAQHPEGVVTSSKLPAPAATVPQLATDQVLTTRGITPVVVPNRDFYRIDTALFVPQVDVATWRLQVTGMVDHPITFTYDELLAMPLYEQYVTIGCVSNQVGGHLVGNALWTGVRLKDVLETAGVQPGATQIVGRSVDDFTAGFPTSWAMDPDREPMIAVGMDRAPLPAAHGFPARLIVPGLYGYVSATKWLSSIELTTREAVDGYWVPLGWAKDAPMLTQSRIDVPAGGQALQPGPVDVAGVAWAPDRGVSRVEVRVDDGAWQAARMSRPLSNATWVQWVIPWTATAGQHAIEVRATDGVGEVQTEEHTAPAPSGARGHHRVVVSVG